MDILKFDCVLNDFRDAVGRKLYTKVDYEMWRKLCREALDVGTMTTMYYATATDTIHITGKEDYTFSIYDYSFGTFLYDKYFANKEIKEEKENKEMKVSSMFNFDFGPVSNGSVRMSPCGMATMNSEGQWVSYDAANDQIVNVEGLTFDIQGMLFKMPVAIKDVQVGDMIVHQGNYVYVIDFPGDSNGLVVVDIEQGENRVVRPTTNLFGFNFVTKVVSMFNMNGFAGSPSADQPFGNIFPLMMMSQMFGESQSSDGTIFGGMDMGQLMMMSMFAGGGNPFANMFAGAPSHGCACGGCSSHEATEAAN